MSPRISLQRCPLRNSITKHSCVCQFYAANLRPKARRSEVKWQHEDSVTFFLLTWGLTLQMQAGPEIFKSVGSTLPPFATSQTNCNCYVHNILIRQQATAFWGRQADGQREYARTNSNENFNAAKHFNTVEFSITSIPSCLNNYDTIRKSHITPSHRTFQNVACQ
jgi:hypothetical protein